MFDIYFSTSHGFEIDFPFLHFWISTPTVALIFVSALALKIRNYNNSRKRVKK